MSSFVDLSNRFAQDWHEFTASYDAYARSVGLSGTSLRVLSTILANGEAESTQESIRAATSLPKQTVHNVIQSFAKLGWLRLVPSDNDRRAKTVRLTTQGEAEARRLIAPVREAEIRAMERLGVEDGEMLVALFARYGALSREIIAEYTGDQHEHEEV